MKTDVELLRELAESGRRVARLKREDPRHAWVPLHPDRLDAIADELASLRALVADVHHLDPDQHVAIPHPLRIRLQAALASAPEWVMEDQKA